MTVFGKGSKTNTIILPNGAYVRANTDWLAACRYGVGICWTPMSKPRHGWSLCFNEAVEKFDVKRFVDTVAETGAEYLIFTAITEADAKAQKCC